jgi:hypothetical protein
MWMWNEMKTLAQKFDHVTSVSVGVFNVGNNEKPSDLGSGTFATKDGKIEELGEALNDASVLPGLYIFPGNLNVDLDPSLKRTPAHYHDGLLLSLEVAPMIEWIKQHVRTIEVDDGSGGDDEEEEEEDEEVE